MLKGLAPIAGKQAGTLILGSMPSASSIQQQQYYAHPRNAFWPLLAHVLSFELGTYMQNVEHLKYKDAAVWDVIGQCERKGSLDRAIVKGSESINPIQALLETYPSISSIGLNGGTATRMFKQYCLNTLPADHKLNIIPLPSTSSAYARMNFEEKCKQWTPLFSNITSKRSY